LKLSQLAGQGPTVTCPQKTSLLNQLWLANKRLTTALQPAEGFEKVSLY
jgi:hypothetical protein